LGNGKTADKPSFEIADRQLNAEQEETVTRSLSVVRLALLLTFLGFVVSAQASVLDQNNPPLNVGLNDGLEWQQQLTVGIGGQLAGITLYTNSGFDTDLVRIGVGSAPFTGTYSFMTTVAIGSTGTFIDTSAANIFLNPGDFFTIDVSGGPGCCNLAGSTKAYGGGDLYLDLNGQFTDYTKDFGYSMAFQSYMNTVPEPGSIMLLGTGVLGLAGVLRRKINL
jgi:PEP-CTERM motif-containing protein